MRPRDVRGGGDGSGALGSGGAAVLSGNNTGLREEVVSGRGGANGKLYSTAGEGCVKYLGGPLRRYSGKAMGSAILEVTVRPPIDVNIDAAGVIEELAWESVEDVLTRVVIVHPPEEQRDEENDFSISGSISSSCDEGNNKSLTPHSNVDANSSSSAGGLNKKLGMEFENVGGLDTQLDDIAVSWHLCFVISLRVTFFTWFCTELHLFQRRVLASRANPAVARRLGVSHVRGILLSGPPGCGKVGVEF